MGKASRRTRAPLAPPARASTFQRYRGLILGGGIAIVCALIIAAGILGSMSKKDSATDALDDSTALPAGALSADDKHPFAIPYAGAKNAKKDAPVVEVWSDFQCPACAMTEAGLSGQNLRALADDGDITVLYRQTSTLDGLLDNDSSERATVAWGCAIDAGHGREYRAVLYAAQPANEGYGWTDADLEALAADSGITGRAADRFRSCVQDGTYLDWARGATGIAEQQGIATLPSVRVNGIEAPRAVLANEQALREFIAGQAAKPSASPAAETTSSSSASPQPTASAE